MDFGSNVWFPTFFFQWLNMVESVHCQSKFCILKRMLEKVWKFARTQGAVRQMLLVVR